MLAALCNERYSRPTSRRNPIREFISFKIGSAISFSLLLSLILLILVAASFILILHRSAMLKLSIVTASDRGFKRAPSQSGHGICLMYPSICSRCLSVSASLWRRRRLGITPSNVAWKFLDRPNRFV